MRLFPWRIMGWTVLAVLFCAVAFHACWFWERTTDQTSYFFAGVDVAHGNWRLHDWVLTPPDFWTSDVALSAFLSLIARAVGHAEISPFLLELQPALMWTALVASALALVRLRLPERRLCLGGSLLVLALFGVPLLTTATAYFVTMSAIHLGTVLYNLWALHHAARFLENGLRRHLMASGLLLWLGIIGDPLLQVSGTLPVLLGCAIGLKRSVSSPKRLLTLVLITLVAGILAPLTLALNKVTGGFVTVPLLPRFVAWNDVGATSSLVLRDILLAFGADPSGLQLADSLPQLARLVLLGICGIVLVQIFRKGRQETVSPSDPFVLFLLLAGGANIASMLVSDRLTTEGFSIATVRYLFPFWACFSIAASLMGARKPAAVSVAMLALAMTVIADYGRIGRPAPGFLSGENMALSDFLLREEPSIGISSWNMSGILEAERGGHLTVMPVGTDASGKLSLFTHIHKRISFGVLKGRPFFVVVPRPSELFDEDAVLRTFGPAVSRKQFGRFLILTYNGL
ncbi:hypothetical protein [Acetobacter sp.]|uniref:hypothetical protein n=1 Tax=Acetobacter sp. TaxID=440 RepID=UPI0039E80D45